MGYLRRKDEASSSQIRTPNHHRSHLPLPSKREREANSRSHETKTQQISPFTATGWKREMPQRRTRQVETHDMSAIAVPKPHDADRRPHPVAVVWEEVGTSAAQLPFQRIRALFDFTLSIAHLSRRLQARVFRSFSAPRSRFAALSVLARY